MISYIGTAVISDIFDDGEAAEYANQNDMAVQKAVYVLNANKAFPVVGATPNKQKAQALGSFRNRWMRNTFFAYTAQTTDIMQWLQPHMPWTYTLAPLTNPQAQLALCWRNRLFANV